MVLATRNTGGGVIWREEARKNETRRGVARREEESRRAITDTMHNNRTIAKTQGKKTKRKFQCI